MFGFSFLEKVWTFLGAILLVVVINFAVELFRGDLHIDPYANDTSQQKTVEAHTEPATPKTEAHKPEPEPEPEPAAEVVKAEPKQAETVETAKADVQDQAVESNAKGKKLFSKCKACHSYEDGKRHKVGPNLYQIVGRQSGTADGYKYSEAMLGYGKTWTREELDAFLTKPKEVVPGTKMSFAGFKDESDRAQLIDYLASFSDTQTSSDTAPQEETEVAQSETAEESAAPAEGAATNETVSDTTMAEEPEASEPVEEQAEVSAPEKIANITLETACAQCHSLTQKRGNKVGPSLWNIVGSQMARDEKYDYSIILKAMSGVWTEGELDKYLESPENNIPGIKSTFSGLPHPENRFEIIQQLRELK